MKLRCLWPVAHPRLVRCSSFIAAGWRWRHPRSRNGNQRSSDSYDIPLRSGISGRHQSMSQKVCSTSIAQARMALVPFKIFGAVNTIEVKLRFFGVELLNIGERTRINALVGGLDQKTFLVGVQSRRLNPWRLDRRWRWSDGDLRNLNLAIQ